MDDLQSLWNASAPKACMYSSTEGHINGSVNRTDKDSTSAWSSSKVGGRGSATQISVTTKPARKKDEACHQAIDDTIIECWREGEFPWCPLDSSQV